MKRMNKKTELKRINFLVSPNDIKLPEFEEIIQNWLVELRKELKEISDYENGEDVEGIDVYGYCDGILNHDKLIEDYREQLKGAISFINRFFHMK